MSPPTPVSQFPTLVFKRFVILGIFRKGRTLLIHHFEIKCRNINIGLSKCSVAFFDSTRNMYIGVLLLGLASCFALSTIACLLGILLACTILCLLACWAPCLLALSIRGTACTPLHHHPTNGRIQGGIAQNKKDIEAHSVFDSGPSGGIYSRGGCLMT